MEIQFKSPISIEFSEHWRKFSSDDMEQILNYVRERILVVQATEQELQDLYCGLGWNIEVVPALKSADEKTRAKIRYESKKIRVQKLTKELEDLACANIEGPTLIGDDDVPF